MECSCKRSCACWRHGTLVILNDLIIYGAVALCVIFGDLLSKAWARLACVDGYEITSWFMCEVAHNRGFSGGLFHDTPAVSVTMLVTVSGIVLGVVLFHAIQQLRLGKSIMAEVLVLSGGLANLIDRWQNGTVTDFISFHTQTFYWSTFNLADVAIVAGVIGMLIAITLSSMSHSEQRID